MLTSQRKSYLLSVLSREGRIIAKDVAEQLALSEDTIRRDLRELAAAGKLHRVHGGALPASPAIADFTDRQRIGEKGKIRIGKVAAAMVRPGSVVIIDGGTTAVQMARQLSPDLVATIVTHSPSVAVELAGHVGLDIILIGGRIFKHSIVATGAIALDAISRIKADICFMGVTGVHPEAGLTTGDFEEAAIKQALSQSAGETVILASAEKIGAVSHFLIQPLKQASAIITDCPLNHEAASAIQAEGVELISA